MPAPLAQPPSVQVTPPASNVARASFMKPSVVIIARAKSLPPSGESGTSRAPASTRSMGRKCPMMPVLLTNAKSTSQPARSAARPSIVRASARPRAPVAQLALPELTITAWMWGSRSWPWSTSSGSAFDWLRVKTAAAAAGRSETSSARSGWPEALIPQAMPPAR